MPINFHFVYDVRSQSAWRIMEMTNFVKMFKILYVGEILLKWSKRFERKKEKIKIYKV